MSYIAIARRSTRRILDTFESYSEVGWERWNVSDHPLVSFGYTVCKALALVNCSMAGLAHFWGPYVDERTVVERYVDRMLADLHVDPSDCSGVVIGPSPHIIEYYCKERGIHLSDTIVPEDHTKKRDVIVIPSRREILLFGEDSRRIRL